MAAHDGAPGSTRRSGDPDIADPIAKRDSQPGFFTNFVARVRKVFAGPYVLVAEGS